MNSGDRREGVIEFIDALLASDLAELEPAPSSPCSSVEKEVRLPPYGKNPSSQAPPGAGRRRYGRALLSKARKTSATLHACEMHPRGRKGSSASKISLMLPTP